MARPPGLGTASGTRCRGVTTLSRLVGRSGPVQIKLIRRVLRLVPIRITELVERALEARAVVRRHLNAGQDAPVVGPMVAVVEERDVPVVPEAVEELQERAGPLRELEAIDQFVPQARGA